MPDPYNLYFTPDGKHAIDVAEGHDTLYFYDPTTWRLQAGLRIPYRGPDHLDFSANGRYFLISTEYGGVVVKVQVQPRRIVGGGRCRRQHGRREGRTGRQGLLRRQPDHEEASR